MTESYATVLRALGIGGRGENDFAGVQRLHLHWAKECRTLGGERRGMGSRSEASGRPDGICAHTVDDGIKNPDSTHIVWDLKPPQNAVGRFNLQLRVDFRASDRGLLHYHAGIKTEGCAIFF